MTAMALSFSIRSVLVGTPANARLVAASVAMSRSESSEADPLFLPWESLFGTINPLITLWSHTRITFWSHMLTHLKLLFDAERVEILEPWDHNRTWINPLKICTRCHNLPRNAHLSTHKFSSSTQFEMSSFWTT